MVLSIVTDNRQFQPLIFIVSDPFPIAPTFTITVVHAVLISTIPHPDDNAFLYNTSIVLPWCVYSQAGTILQTCTTTPIQPKCNKQTYHQLGL